MLVDRAAPKTPDDIEPCFSAPTYTMEWLRHKAGAGIRVYFCFHSCVWRGVNYHNYRNQESFQN